MERLILQNKGKSNAIMWTERKDKDDDHYYSGSDHLSP